MNTRSIILTVFACIISVLVIKAQTPAEFPNDSSFIQKMSDFMDKNRKKEGRKYMESFQSIYNSEKMTQEQRNDIVTVSNLLLKKNAPAFPYFRDYFNLMVTFIYSPLDKDNYNEWKLALMDIFNDKTKYLSDIERFIEFTQKLIEKNYIIETPSIRWTSSSGNYRFYHAEPLKVAFETTDLTCFSGKDSIRILQTKGVYDVLKKTWHGEQGTVNWQKAGFPENFIFAKLDLYTIDMSLIGYKADSVLFTNLANSKEPLLGSLEDKIELANVKENVTYPRFESYEAKIELKNIVPGIDFKGAYALYGYKLLGIAPKDGMASLTIHHGDTVLLTARSKSFNLNTDPVVAYNTSITIPLQKDSIYHKGLLFKYFVNKRMVALIRNNKDISQMWYVNTYHNYDMDAELIEWNIDSTRMFFKNLPGATRNKARFRSINYFTMDDYQKFEGYDLVNPIAAVRAFYQRSHKTEFATSELARDMKRNFEEIHRMLIRLSYEGFVDYDIETKIATIRPKLEHYILSKQNKKDFDVIEIVSDTTAQTPSAILDLQNYELISYGSDSVPLNIKTVPRMVINGKDTVKYEEQIPVTIKPAFKKIKVFKDRNFEFSGEFNLGSFQFVGRKFFFEYNNFRMNLDSVDYLKVWLTDVDKQGRKKSDKKEVKNKIENIKGYVLLDDPKNKSGAKANVNFPIFSSRDTSYVFYSDTAIQEIAYPAEKFYYKIDPYEVDSLYEFTTKNWILNGTFYSGGIIPTLREKLTIVKDSTIKYNRRKKEEVASFGFTHKIKPQGMELYGRKDARLFNEMRLSMKGLIGDGKMDYITSTSKSKEFKFYMDSMACEADEFYNMASKQPEYPSAKGLNLHLRWEPTSEILWAYTKKKPISVFNDEKLLQDSIFLTGTLKLKPSELSGAGKMDFENSLLTSNRFVYKSKEFHADTSDFILKSLKRNGEASFKTNNVQAKIDLKAKEGRFKANDKLNSKGEFPQNEYICLMGNYDWYMERKRIEMLNDAPAFEMPADTSGLTAVQKEDLTLYGSTYISVRKGQDSLNFISNSANYDIEKSIITAYNVKLIRCADATIYPSSEVVIGEKANMQTLNKARIVANNQHRLHTITGATVNVLGRLDYTGSGTYEYIDVTNKAQYIKFEDIRVDSMTTVAQGVISENQNFRLSPEYTFDGEVFLRANIKYLTFKGYTEISHNCDKFGIKPSKFKFNTLIRPDEIYIPVSANQFNNKGQKIFTGFYITKDSIYATFLSEIRVWSDHPMILADGYVFYDKNSKNYMVSNKQKLLDPFAPGNLVQMHKEFCNLTAEGRMQYGVDLGQVKLISAGSISLEEASYKVNLDVLLGIDFFIPDQCMDVMAERFVEAQDLKGINLATTNSRKILYELAGMKATNRVIESLTESGTYKVPDSLQHTITINSITLKWNPPTNSFMSVGEIGLGSINKTEINKFVKGYVEIIKKRTGDEIYIYLKINKENWFFFKYSNAQLLTISSVEKFNNVVIKTKEKNRKLKVGRDETPYAFYPSSNDTKNMFLTKFIPRSEIDDIEGNEQVIDLPEEEIKKSEDSPEVIEEKKEEIKKDEDGKKEDIQLKKEVQENVEGKPESKEEKVEDTKDTKTDEIKEESKKEKKKRLKEEKKAAEEKKQEDLRKHIFDDEDEEKEKDKDKKE